MFGRRVKGPTVCVEAQPRPQTARGVLGPDARGRASPGAAHEPCKARCKSLARLACGRRHGPRRSTVS